MEASGPISDCNNYCLTKRIECPGPADHSSNKILFPKIHKVTLLVTVEYMVPAHVELHISSYHR